MATRVIPVSAIESYVPLPEDSDGDGLPDAWEMRWFGNLDQNASGDHDLDGISNLQEYRQGTVPRLDPTDSDVNERGRSQKTNIR